jgi:integrase
MIRRTRPKTLREYLAEYQLSRDLRSGTVRQYRIAVSLLDRWAGHAVRLDELDERLASEWLAAYAETAAPHTVRAKKQSVLSLWRAASDEGLCDEPRARRVRRVRLPELVVVAWTRDEVEQLLAAAATLPRWHRCGLRRAAWWDLAIRVAWDSGIRWGDLVALRVDQIGPDGAGTLSQSKTRKVSSFRLSPSTLAALRSSLEACPRRLVCPWPTSPETFRDQMTRLVAKAGVRPGTWKWIRRGSGTDVELQARGLGHRHLGNTPAVFRASYEDQTLTGTGIPSPRELRPPPDSTGQGTDRPAA